VKRYLPSGGRVRKVDRPEGVRIVHNFYPGPHDDPGREREVGLNGFRVWITDEQQAEGEHRCYCGWLDGREHWGTVAVIQGRRVR
jgi:hypothetical protein